MFSLLGLPPTILLWFYKVTYTLNEEWESSYIIKAKFMRFRPRASRRLDTADSVGKVVFSDKFNFLPRHYRPTPRNVNTRCPHTTIIYSDRTVTMLQPARIHRTKHSQRSSRSVCSCRRPSRAQFLICVRSRPSGSKSQQRLYSPIQDPTMSV